MNAPSPELLAKLGQAADVFEKLETFNTDEKYLLNQWFHMMGILPNLAASDPSISFNLLEQMRSVSNIMLAIKMEHASLFVEIINEVIDTARMIEADGETRQ